MFNLTYSHFKKAYFKLIYICRQIDPIFDVLEDILQFLKISNIKKFPSWSRFNSLAKIKLQLLADIKADYDKIYIVIF